MAIKADIKDIKLAAEGKKRIEWAHRHMKVLSLIADEFRKKKPLKGMRIGACLHVTTETANLMKTLAAGGAQVALCASNPLSTNDAVAASLVKDDGISVFAIRGEGRKTYYDHINSSLDLKPHITMDDGADVISILHSKRRELIGNVIGGTEETTTGVIRLRGLQERNLLEYPVIAVNDAETKHLFDNRFGTGQSTLDGILRATNILLAGKQVVVFGYGWCGKGIAMRARGMGASVIVCEVDPIRGLEAAMSGFRVMEHKDAARLGDIFITVTGCCEVVRLEHMRLMKDSAVICNSGHFDVELQITELKKASKKRKVIRSGLEEFTLKNGKRICLLGEGRLVNLSCAEGHPASVMDMSFCNQALAATYLVSKAKKLEKKVYKVPEAIDQRIARLKLKTMGIKIGTLTKVQKDYLASWEIGT